MTLNVTTTPYWAWGPVQPAMTSGAPTGDRPGGSTLIPVAILQPSSAWVGPGTPCWPLGPGLRRQNRVRDRTVSMVLGSREVAAVVALPPGRP